jgi:hypothetical protein
MRVELQMDLALYQRAVKAETEAALLRAALDQKHAEYEDLQQCAENSARNLIREINDMRDVLHRMLEAPTTQVSASWKRELQQELVRK